MMLVLHLGFVLHVFGATSKGFGSLYHHTKFGWNRCSRYDAKISAILS